MTLGALLLLAVLHAPEECLTAKSAITVVHEGKTYAFRYEDCRAEFLSDPERYAQLYDALLEMQAAGMEIAPPPQRASLVPS